MLNKSSQTVVVTSKSFSRNEELRALLLSKYHKVKFNEEGKSFSPADLVSFLQGYESAIIGLEKINTEILVELPELKLISKYGVGLDNIDLQALMAHNVCLSWRGGVNRRGVAELTLSLILNSLRKSTEANFHQRRGEWQPLVGENLTGKTVGIVGMGHVGKELVELLRPFRCQILVHDLIIDENFCKENLLTSLDLYELLEKSEIVTLHLPLTSKTRGLFSSKTFSKMRKGSILINTARGEIVNMSALYECLVNKQIKAAACDVFELEPFVEKRFMELPQFFSTPHIGGSSKESILAMGMSAIEGLERRDKMSIQRIKELLYE